MDDLTDGAASAVDCDSNCTDGVADCSLRDAVAATNSGDVIKFETGLSGTMDISSVIILSKGNVTIDGESNGHSHDIAINGNISSYNCFQITSASNVIKGMVIQDCNVGVVIFGDAADNNKIKNNYIGINTAGNAAVSNYNGIAIYNSADNNVIGTEGDGVSDSNEGNIISGNLLLGLYIDGIGTTGNIVAGNRIGTDVTGTSALPNGSVGFQQGGMNIRLGASYNVVGVDDNAINPSAMANIISGNTGSGIIIERSGTNYNIVAGNKIGVDITGNVDLGNKYYGIFIYVAASFNQIGTDEDGNYDELERNIISGNQDGVSLIQNNAHDNSIVGNYIGTNEAGTAGVGNSLTGVLLSQNASSNLVRNNLISGNGTHGIYVWGSNTEHTINNDIEGNIIGLDVTGTARIPNTTGIYIYENTSNTRIGTDGNGVNDEAERNIISGNNTVGIYLDKSHNNTIAGNYIGTDINGSNVSTLGNNSNGISLIFSSSGNNIGGDADVEANVIRFNGDSNGDYGVYINAGAGNRVLRNTIYDNWEEVQLIVTSFATTTPSSLASSAGSANGEITISMDSAVGNIVQVFEDSDLDADCEAMSYLDDATDNGDGTFSILTNNLPDNGTKVAVTATDATNNTSVMGCYTIENLAPVLAPIGNKTAVETSLLQFGLSAYDPNVGDTLTFGSLNFPAGSQFVSPNFSWTPTYADAGIYSNVEFNVSDGALSDNELISIIINNINQGPVIGTISDYNGQTGDSITLAISATDPDVDDTLTYSATNLPNGANFDNISRTFSWTPEIGQAGIYVVTFTVTDNGSVKQGGSNSFTSVQWTLNISESATSLEASAGANLFVPFGRSVTLNSSVSGGSGDYSYQWFQTSGEFNVLNIADTVSSALTFIAPNYVTTLGFKLTVTDKVTGAIVTTNEVLVKVYQSEISAESLQNYDGYVVDATEAGEPITVSRMPDSDLYQAAIGWCDQIYNVSCLSSANVRFLSHEENIIVSESDYSTAENEGTGRISWIAPDRENHCVDEVGDVECSITGSKAGAHLGADIAVSDLNGDNIDEAIITEPGSDDFGKISLFDKNCDDLSDVLGSSDANLTTMILDASDIDSDDKGDIVVFTKIYDPNSPAQGASEENCGYIIKGSDSLVGDKTLPDSSDGSICIDYPVSDIKLGDFNCDGNKDVAVASVDANAVFLFTDLSDIANIGSANYIIEGPVGSDFGYAMVVTDFTNDECDDLFIGAPAAENTRGAVYLVFGQTDPSELTEIDISILGSFTGSFLGENLVAGDLTCDGLIDIAVYDHKSEKSILIDRARLFANPQPFIIGIRGGSCQIVTSRKYGKAEYLTIMLLVIAFVSYKRTRLKSNQK